jgi:EpsD family peptidyl-prolyl cis-trans isomerase
MTPLLSNPLYLFVIATSLLFTGCDNSENKENDQTGQSIALINGKPVTSHQFNSLVRQAAANTQGPVNLHAIGQKIIDQELAIQESLRLKLDRRPEILEKLELARREILAGAYADLIEQNIKPATFVEIQNYYQANPALFETRKIYQLRVFRLPLVLRENADFVATLKQSPKPHRMVIQSECELCGCE